MTEYGRLTQLLLLAMQIVAAVQCPALVTPVNGRKDGSGTGHNDRVEFSCDQGFSLNGESVLTCQGDGTWSSDVPECTAVQCPALNAPIDGGISYYGTDYNDRVEFSCDQGFSLHGESVLTCQSDGTWSSDVPECTDACRNPPEIENASHDVKQSYANGERLHYSCNPGYEAVSNSYLQCVDGNWLEADIRCTAKSCGHPGDINNGGIIEGVYTYPNSVTYVCDEGFTLNGRTTRTCQANTDWSGIAPTCNPVQCLPLDTPVNGRKDGSGTGYNDRVEFSCDERFSLNGESVLTCQGDGTWSADVPECTDTCRNPPEIENGSHDDKQSYANGERLHYSCNPGYEPVSNSYLQCVDGNWSEADIRCTAKSCGQPGDINNGGIIEEVYTYPNSVTYVCDEGFTLNGRTTRTCQATTDWSGIAPSCNRSCDPTDLPYGDVDGNKRTVQVIPEHELFGTLTRNGQYLRVKCPEGYEQRGSRYMKCQEGEWTPYRRPSFPGRPPLCINV